MSALKYRPDIDGLRALAVLMVVIFHADLGLFEGGFVGVDVFFVISGYLITSLIARDVGAGRFSLLHFWERRIRRILPALAAMIFATVLAGFFVFLPAHFIGLGEQTAWQSITASNFYFWTQVGYFNTAHELKPLLHTWSLAVEEQFYLFFPILFLLLYRTARKYFMPALWFAAALSLVACIWATSYYPDAAFFLLPFRTWELLAGSLLALHVHKDAPLKAREITGWIGLIFIFVAGLLFTSKTSFPGIAALLPCIGAVLLIWGGAGGQGGVYRFLSHKATVFVGLVSYLWYLWHWPILSMGEYVLQNEFGKAERIGGILLSFALACLSWKFIETPFRRSGGVLKTRRAVFIAAFVTLGAMAVIGLLIVQKAGLPERLSKEAQLYASGTTDRNPLRRECGLNQYDRLLKGEICEANAGSGIKPTFIVWGDSQADAISPAFVTLSKKYGMSGYLALKPGCPPILDIRHEKDDRVRPFCQDYNARHFDFIRNSGIKDVFYIANWTNWVRDGDLYFDGEHLEWYDSYKEKYFNVLMAGVQRTVDEMHKNGIRVHFLLNMPAMDFDPPRALAIEAMLARDESKAYVMKDKYLGKRERDLNDFIATNEGNDFIVYDTAGILCPQEKCFAAHDGRSLYSDNGHLSAYGANYVSPIFEPFFKNAKGALDRK